MTIVVHQHWNYSLTVNKPQHLTSLYDYERAQKFARIEKMDDSNIDFGKGSFTLSSRYRSNYPNHG